MPASGRLDGTVAFGSRLMKVGLLACFGLVFFGIARGRWRQPSYWIAAAIAAGGSIAIVAPFFLPYVRVQEELGFTRSVEEAAHYAADWQAWLEIDALYARPGEAAAVAAGRSRAG